MNAFVQIAELDARKRKGCSWKVARCPIHFTVKPLHCPRFFQFCHTGDWPLGKLKKRVAHISSDKPTLEIPWNLQGLLDKPPWDWDRAIHLEVCNSPISKIPGLVKPGTSAWQWHFLGLFLDHLHSHRFGGRCFCFSCQLKVGAHAMATFPARLQELSLLDSTKSIKFDYQWNFAGGFSTSKFASPFSIMQARHR